MSDETTRTYITSAFYWDDANDNKHTLNMTKFVGGEPVAVKQIATETLWRLLNPNLLESACGRSFFELTAAEAIVLDEEDE